MLTNDFCPGCGVIGFWPRAYLSSEAGEWIAVCSRECWFRGTIAQMVALGFSIRYAPRPR